MALIDIFKRGLAKSARNIRERMQDVFMGGSVSGDFLDFMEEALIQADVGIAAASMLRERLVEETRGNRIRTEEELFLAMQSVTRPLFDKVAAPLSVASQGPTVYVLLGVNGSGKTTTIAKLAKRWREQGRSVTMAASDTFRAAAGDQLAEWARRTGSGLVQHKEGSDPSAVAFDAVRSAVAKKTDLLLVDTAGRLHTHKNLMEELKKIVRIIGRELPGAPHETLLVIDGTTGQNGLNQARAFAEAVGVSGIALTKLDGSSKGGIAIAIAYELGIPIKLLGMGEAAEDLKDFDSDAFTKALFDL